MLLLASAKIIVILSAIALVQCEDVISTGRTQRQWIAEDNYVFQDSPSTGVAPRECGRYEKWYSCLPRCSITCVNIQNDRCLVNDLPCRQGCECRSGYARWGDGHACQKIEECRLEEGVRIIEQIPVFDFPDSSESGSESHEEKNNENQHHTHYNFKKPELGLNLQDFDIDLPPIKKPNLDLSLDLDELQDAIQKPDFDLSFELPPIKKPNIDLSLDLDDLNDQLNIESSEENVQHHHHHHHHHHQLPVPSTTPTTATPATTTTKTTTKPPKPTTEPTRTTTRAPTTEAPTTKPTTGDQCKNPNYFLLNGKCTQKKECGPNQELEVGCRHCAATDRQCQSTACVQRCICRRPFLVLGKDCVKPIDCGERMTTQIICQDGSCKQRCVCKKGYTSVNGNCVNLGKCNEFEVWEMACEGGVCKQTCNCAEGYTRIGKTCEPVCEFPKKHKRVCDQDGCVLKCVDPVCPAWQQAWRPGICEYVCQGKSIQCPLVDKDEGKACVCGPAFMRDSSGACVPADCNGVRPIDGPPPTAEEENALCPKHERPWYYGVCEHVCVDGVLKCIEVEGNEEGVGGGVCVCKQTMLKHIFGKSSKVPYTTENQCVCKEDFMRDESGVCVPKECPIPECPFPSTKKNGVCVNPTCNEKRKPWSPGVCENVCINGVTECIETRLSERRECVCKRDWYRNAKGICVANECVPTEGSCRSLVHGRCLDVQCEENRKPWTAGVCENVCTHGVVECIETPESPDRKCVCKRDLMRNAMGFCVPEYCPKPECPFPKTKRNGKCQDPVCGSRSTPFVAGACENTCTDVGVRCVKVKYADDKECICKPDFMRNADGACVPKTDGICPRKCPYPLNLEKGVCRNPQCGGRRVQWSAGICEYVCEKGELKCVEPPQLEERKCICRHDWMRNAEGVCVPKECKPRECPFPLVKQDGECSTPVCSQSTVPWTKGACENRCSHGILECVPMDETDDRVCVCKKDLINVEGICVKENADTCPEPDCPYPTVDTGDECVEPACDAATKPWRADVCEDTCTDEGVKCIKVYAADDKPCVCKSGFMRNSVGKCVPKVPGSCPVKCVFPQRLENGVCVDPVCEDRRVLWTPDACEFVCIDGALQCVDVPPSEDRKCLCKHDWMRNGEGLCVPQVCVKPECPFPKVKRNGECVDPQCNDNRLPWTAGVCEKVCTFGVVECVETKITDERPCVCEDNLMRNDKGVCVPENCPEPNCAYPMLEKNGVCVDPNCADNAKPWEEDVCENTCTEEGLKCLKVLVADKQRCVCKPDYVRNAAGFCVRITEGVCPVVCDYPKRLEDGVCVEPTCDDRRVLWTPGACENVCVNGVMECIPAEQSLTRKCICASEWMRSSDGSCVTPKCEDPPCPFPMVLRDGECVDPECSANRTPWSPGACEKVCTHGVVECVEVKEWEAQKCVCNSDLMKNANGVCVPEMCPEPDCPFPQTRVNGVCQDPDCDATSTPWVSGICENACGVVGVNCTTVLVADNKPCVCKPDYMRSVDGFCVPKASYKDNCNKECPYPTRLENGECVEPVCESPRELWTPGACENVCVNGGMECAPALMNPFRKCICQKDYMRIADGTCVAKNCSTPDAPFPLSLDPTTGQFIQPVCSANTKPWTKGVCENRCSYGVIECIETPATDLRKCVCKQDFIRNDKGVCVAKVCPKPECPFPQSKVNGKCVDYVCKPNERPWSNKVCEKRCGNRGLKCVKVKLFQGPKCLCKPGFVRDDKGVCLPELNIKCKCPDPYVLKNGVCVAPVCNRQRRFPWYSGACEYVCQDGELKCVVQPFRESRRCLCKHDYMKNADGVCVAKKCPEKCPFPQEHDKGGKCVDPACYTKRFPWYEGACEYVCENGELSCVEQPQNADRPCLCKPEYMRNADDVCVEKECKSCPYPQSLENGVCKDPVCSKWREPWTPNGCEYQCVDNSTLTCIKSPESENRTCLCTSDWMRDSEGICVNIQCPAES